MIIENIKDSKAYVTYLDNFRLYVPDQFVPDKVKRSPDWIKTAMDYYYTIALSQWKTNTKLKKPYELLEGNLTMEDYYSADLQQAVDFMSSANVQLPDYIKHYPIVNPPINTLLGEVNDRPDNNRFIAIDSYTRTASVEEQNEFLQSKVEEYVNNVMMLKAQKAGLLQQKQQLAEQIQELQQTEDPNAQQQLEQLNQQIQQIDQEIQGFTPEWFKYDKSSSTQHILQEWSNLKLEQLKLMFQIPHKNTEALKDLLAVAREFHHVYIDNESHAGLGYEILNPRKVWFLSEPDPILTNDCYAIGYLDYWEISKIISRFKLSEEEIDHLKAHKHDYMGLPTGDKNVWETTEKSWASMSLPQHDPSKTLQEAVWRSEFEQDNILSTYKEESGDYAPSGYHGHDSRMYKYSVCIAYFKSKRKVGKLTYTNEDGELETIVVSDDVKLPDTTYTIEWEWKNVWYRGVRIGVGIYFMEPLYYTDLPPIMGVFQKNKNALPTSTVDKMKVYQIIYNICMNQIYLLLEKEIGKVLLYNMRHLPKYKDFQDSEALDMFIDIAKGEGIIGLDDSPENVKGASTFNQFTAIDLTRTQEIKSRIELATWCKYACWELLGFTQQRLGSTTATETATGVEAGITQSYAQTEPLIALHEQCMMKVYQLLIDTAQFVEADKPDASIHFVNSEQQEIMFRINGSKLKLADFAIFPSDRRKDKRRLDELRQRSLEFAQNNLHPYYISVINRSESVHEIEKVLKQDYEQKLQQEAQMQQIEQQKQQQLQEIEQQRFQLQQQLVKEEQAFKAKENALDRKKDIMIAQINALKFAKDNDVNTNNVPDALEIEKFNAEYARSMQELNQQKTNALNDYNVKLKELDLKEEEIRSKERIAKDKNKTMLKNKVAGEK